MKKLLTATLATLMVCAMAACGGNSNSTSNSSPAPSTPSTSNSTPGGNNSTPGGNNSTPGGNNSTPGGNNSTPGGNNGISTPSVTKGTVTFDFSGAETTTVQNSSYNVFDGISVQTSTGVELKTRTTATSDCGMDGKLLNTSEVRTCKIDYSITFVNGGVEYSGTDSRTVEVVAPTIQEGNLVSNPSFELGTTDWELATHEGGTGEFTVEKTDVMGTNKNAAKVVMTGLNWTNDSSPRLNSATYATNGAGEDKRFDMLGGKNYKVSFKAKALATKNITVSIGQLMPASPWYEGFTSSEQSYKAEVTSQWQEFEYTFTATHANLEDCSILFSMGRVAPTSEVITTLWFADVYVGIYEGNVLDNQAPSFTGINDSLVSSSSTPFNLLAGITANDNVDGDVTANIKAYYNNEEVTTLNVATPGTFVINYEVTDAANNKATATRTITVVAAGTNLLPNVNAARLQNDSWCETWLTQAFTDEADGSVKIHTVGIGEQSYVNQININSLPCIGGVSYTLTLEVKTDIALKVSFIQNRDPWAIYAEANIPVSSNFQTITLNINADSIDSVNKLSIELGTVASDITFYIRNVKLVQN